MTKEIVDCGVLRRAGLEVPACCGSCHEDYEEFNYSLCCLLGEGMDDYESEICCAVAQAINPMNDDVRHKLEEYFKGGGSHGE